jgi:hypothetical protein
MSMRCCLATVVLLATAFVTSAQTAGENVNLWHQVKPTSRFSADTLWLGGVFLRDTTKDLIVWWVYNEAGLTGRLYFINAAGDTVFLFTNKQNGASVNLTQMGYDVGFGNLDTIFFAYAVLNGSAVDMRYTGPNRRPGDGAAQGGPYAHYDRYSSDSINVTPMAAPNAGLPPKRRWCVAGQVRDNGVRTDTVEFGFEDLAHGDFDYDDIVFHVSGVFLNHPPTAQRIVLQARPATTIHAGDSVVITATVYLDSVDQTGAHHVITRPYYNAQVRWNLGTPPADNGNVGLRLGAGPTGTNTFYSRRAWVVDTIIASFTDSLGNVVTQKVPITVQPGPAEYLDVEPDPQIDLWTPQRAQHVDLPVGTNADTLWAVVRDHYDNFVDSARSAVWTPRDGQIATAARLGGKAWVGQVGRGPGVFAYDTTWVVVSQGSLRPDSVVVRVQNPDITGPSITSALYYLGNPPGVSGPRRADTLIITFSEPVRLGDLQSLKDAIGYTDDSLGAGAEGTVFAGAVVAGSSDSLVTRLVIVFPGGTNLVTPAVDHVTLKPTVHDVVGNPAPSDAPPVVITWGREYDVIIDVSANPFRPGVSPVPVAVIQSLDPLSVGRNGPAPTVGSTVIRVASIQRVDDAHSLMRVYDALGNLVADNVPCYAALPQDHENAAYFFWDGRNRNGRMVGSGTYLAVIQVRKTSGAERVTKQKIGVSR